MKACAFVFTSALKSPAKLKLEFLGLWPNMNKTTNNINMFTYWQICPCPFFFIKPNGPTYVPYMKWFWCYTFFILRCLSAFLFVLGLAISWFVYSMFIRDAWKEDYGSFHARLRCFVLKFITCISDLKLALYHQMTIALRFMLPRKQRPMHSQLNLR